MKRISNDVKKYIDGAPPGHQPAMREIREMIVETFPEAREQVGEHGFALYTIGEAWVAGFATRSKGPMFYCMVQPALDKHEKKFGRLRSGKSCVEYRAAKHITMDEMRETARQVLTDAATMVRE